MNNILANYMSQIVLSLFLMLAAWLGVQAKNLYNNLVTTEIKQAVCRTAVRFVEQLYVDIHGEEKLRAAMAKASDLLAGYGIRISDDELIAMLEAAVNEFNSYYFEKSGTTNTKPPDGDPYKEFKAEMGCNDEEPLI
jgi:hypothetical protein